PEQTQSREIVRGQSGTARPMARATEFACGAARRAGVVFLEDARYPTAMGSSRAAARRSATPIRWVRRRPFFPGRWLERRHGLTDEPRRVARVAHADGSHAYDPESRSAPSEERATRSKR